MRSLNKKTRTVPPARKAAPIQMHDLMQIEVLIDSALCNLRVWTEDEWAALPEHARPAQFIHAPGLGWVGGVPVIRLN